MNKWVILGNLGHDPKRGTSQNGKTLCYMDVAVSKNGGRDVDWVNVTAFGNTAENCLRYLHKGSEIVAGGTASAREWQGRDGVYHSGLSMAADFVEFGRGGSERTQSDEAPAQTVPAPVEAPVQESSFTPVSDDDLPF